MYHSLLVRCLSPLPAETHLLNTKLELSCDGLTLRSAPAFPVFFFFPLLFEPATLPPLFLLYKML